MIHIRELYKNFGSFRALDGLNLTVEKGQVLGLLGPNGSGKTTTVKVLTTLLSPGSGSVSVAGYSVVDQPQQVRRSIGLSGQYAAVDEKLTGFENLYMVGRLYGMSRRNSSARATELLADFRLSEVAGKLTGAYSGGMRRRLDLAGAIVARPPVVVLDEPTTGLDPRGRLETWDAVSSLVAEGTTVLLTTQYLDEADRLADNIAVIDAGRVIAEGTAGELKARAGSDRIDVVVAEPHQLSEVARVLTQVANAGGLQGHSVEQPEIDSQTNRISIAASGGHHMLVRGLRDLDEAGLTVVEASLRRPTLDDVFLRLTGERTDQDSLDETEQESESQEERISS